MQAVKGPHSEFWPVAASQISTDVECIVRNVNAYPQPSVSIIFEFILCSTSFHNGHVAAKDLCCDSMHPFGKMKRGDPRCRTGSQQSVGIG